MELKRILARDSRTANEKAIQLYGKEVMIISSQRVDNQIELVVAVETTPASHDDGVHHAEKTVSGSAELPSFGKVFMEAQLAAKPVVQAPVSDGRPALPTQEVDGANEALVSMHEMKRSQEIVSLLRQEIAILREDLLLTMRGRMSAGAGALAPVAQDILHRLAEAGMPASMQFMFESGLEKADSVADGLNLVSKTLYKTMKRKISPQPSSGWHAVVGPSGAGKTSMVARLALAAAQVHGAERQAIVSFQDGRAGSWAQIQVLASQAGVDCFRAQDLAALQSLLEDLGPRRTVWVDTPGVNFMTAVPILHALNVQIHVVLPVDATAAHAQQVLQKSESPWASLMLSKLDEATPSWSMIRSLCDTRLPVPCMATHAGISAGLLPYDPQALIDRALQALGPELPVPPAVKTRPKAARSSTASPRASASRKSRETLTKAVHG